MKQKEQIEKKYQEISTVYRVDNPKLIREKIMFRYLTLLVRNQVPPGQREALEHHIEHFETCMQYEQLNESPQ